MQPVEEPLLARARSCGAAGSISGGRAAGRAHATERGKDVVAGATELRVVLADRREFDAVILLTGEATDLAMYRARLYTGNWDILSFRPNHCGGDPGQKMVRLQIFILSEYRFPPPSSSENRDLCRVESDNFRENKCF